MSGIGKDVRQSHIKHIPSLPRPEWQAASRFLTPCTVWHVGGLSDVPQTLLYVLYPQGLSVHRGFI